MYWNRSLHGQSKTQKMSGMKVHAHFQDLFVVCLSRLLVGIFIKQERGIQLGLVFTHQLCIWQNWCHSERLSQVIMLQ